MKKIFKIIVTILFFIGCSQENNDVNSPESGSDGQGGSLAKFTLKGNYLYTVDEFKLTVFNIAEEKNPVEVNEEYIGFDIETLFSYKDYLYIGSRNGMFIYDISNPEFPEFLSSVQHFTACDPVVANDTHAFVTLHSETFCGGNINLLETYDVSEITSPILINSRNLTYPKGLGLVGDFLIVCDNEIKIFDISNPEESKLVNSFNKEAFDVIIQNELLIAIGKTGVYQFKITPDTTKGLLLEQISEISI